MTTPTDAEIMREAAMVGGLFDDLAIGYQSEDILKFARAVLAKWGQPQAVAGGDPVARVLLDCSGQPMVNPELLAAKELADPVAFDTMYPHRAPHRVAMLYPDAPPPQAVREPQCWCLTCRPMRLDDPHSIRMALCPTCGNKRCPKANDHRNACTHSNEPGQPGSAYPDGITANSGKGDGNADT
ncbi:hypothetical protein [Acidovorax sp. NB1]|uniref:hypothetical protein n=1 Tax=Acidovorax sp. NB1 TaxID=1943571 RepID=UPI0010DEAE0F|nr:hypothetical protein [Acidovorax sp. NB1]GDY37746.1 hypothetical protein ACINB_36380 [Acidovorax sp. NB1]